jgi:hypothetical protein
VLVHDFAAPVLTEAGYTKKRRTFRLVNELGDEAAIMFRSFIGYLLDAGVTHRPVRDPGEEFRPDTMSSGSWHQQWAPDSETVAILGPVPTAAALQLTGERLVDQLRHEVLPAVTRMLDRRVLVDAMRSGSTIITVARGPAVEAWLLADLGPSLALDNVLTCVTDEVAVYVRERLAELGTTGDQWRAQVRSSRERLDAVLAQ